MTGDGIKGLLADYAEGARLYDVSVRAVGRARRRSAMRGVVPASASVIVVALLTVTWLGLANSGPPADDPTTTPVEGCPHRITPAAPTATLPADRPVGKGCLVYTSRTTNAPVLVVDDGTQYQLPQLVRGPSIVNHGLSPDGEWLAMGDTPGSTTVRDLATTGTLAVAGLPLAWSPDSGWLATGTLSSAENPGLVTLTRPTDDSQTAVDLSPFARTRVVSVLTTGEPVLAPLDGGATLELIIVDPATGTEKRRLEVDPRVWQPGRHDLTVLADPIFTTDGRVLARLTRQLGPQVVPGDVLVIDLQTATVVGQWHLPTATVDETWESLSMVPEGLLLLHHTPTKTLRLELYDPATTSLKVVLDMTAISAKGS